MTRVRQTEEAYPDLSSLKRELERTTRERNKANLDRDQAKLERDQANLERDQAVIEKDRARRELDMLKAEHQQEQRVRENTANCEQLKRNLSESSSDSASSRCKREPGSRSEWPPVQDQSHVWRWMKLPDRRDGLTLTARSGTYERGVGGMDTD